MCKVFKVSRSCYYDSLKGSVSKRAKENEKLLTLIKQEHKKSKQRYGSPRITKALKAKEVQVSRPRVARLMKQAKIRAKMVRRFRVTTDSKHCYAISENLLNRNFTAATTGQVWVSDITYIRTLAGWLYLTVVLDLADRKIIGWALSETMRAKETTVAALQMAIKNRPVLQELIFHSDRGVQYACDEFRKELKAYPLICQSMSRRANCWDNAVAESFFKTLKTECVYGNRYQDQRRASIEIFEYIEIFYNRERLHSSLGYRTPEQMEELLNTKSLAA
ncbi:insertion element IS2 transposase InsD [Cesiribacter andamanensis AMV16]|uniref:Insertion element IS2 transposase InsD n=2 Tax=Cesiribacter TaxID=1133570 RepID=M7NS47_9BACT|nr:insertion element IS2 transposase InsD [Cesiribacter andamanensis AMV16]